MLVAAAGVGLFSAASGAGRHGTHPYLVAARDLTAGARLQPSDLATTELELPASVRGRLFDDPAVLDGATLLSPLAAGELVQAGAVVAGGANPGTRELTFTVERGRIGPTIGSGERIDLLATYSSGDDAFTIVAGRDLPVLSVDRSRVGAGDTSPVLVTVSVASQADAVAMAHASQAGKLTVVRATGVLPGEAAPAYRAPASTQP